MLNRLHDDLSKRSHEKNAEAYFSDMKRIDENEQVIQGYAWF